MHKAQIINYLSNSSKTEKLRFHDFVHSPFFNKHENTKHLLDYIYSVDDWDSKKLDRKLAFAFLFPDKTFDEQLIHNLLSYLLRLYRRFKAYQNLEKKPIDESLALLDEALDNNQQKLFVSQSKKLASTLAKTEAVNGSYYLQLSQLQQLKDKFDIKFGKRTSSDHLEKAITNFDQFYWSEKLRMACQMLARHKVTGAKYDFTPIDQLILSIQKDQQRFESIPSIWLYYLIFKMTRSEDQGVFKSIKRRIPKDIHHFPEAEGRDLFTHILNFCIGQINRGNSDFRKETFEIYQQMLSSGLIYQEGKLPQWDYTNIVSLGCQTSAFDWTRKFIYEQKEYLPIQERDNTFTFNLASFHYSQQQYDPALELLQQVNFTDVYYNLFTRILQIKIYWETKNWQTLDYALDTFRIYLLRHRKMEDKRKKSGLNLIRFTKKILTFAELSSTRISSSHKEKILNLKSKVEQNDLVLQKAWLLQVIEQTLNSNF